jgi:hypothetical protein
MLPTMGQPIAIRCFECGQIMLLRPGTSLCIERVRERTHYYHARCSPAKPGLLKVTVEHGDFEEREWTETDEGA